MAAAALGQSHSARQETGLQPTRLARDLYQIAELIELCFGTQLDANGTAAVREMKAIARLGPLLWLLSFLDRAGLGVGRGYVWRHNGRVMGNVSLYRGGIHPVLGKGWLIANVAVHPDYRRRGLAHTLMRAAMDLAHREGGRWVALQVETSNEAALSLYDNMGFVRYETLEQWETSRFTPPLILDSASSQIAHPRRWAEVRAEADLIYSRARLGAMAWTRPIARSDIWDAGPWGPVFSLGGREHWILSTQAQGLTGALWIEAQNTSQARLSLFLDPALEEPAVRQILLRQALNLHYLRGRSLRIETTADDPPVEELLRESGFRKVRSLIQMRKVLQESPPGLSQPDP